MEVRNTRFDGLKIYYKRTFVDKRGYTREIFDNKLIKKKFPFDLLSSSKKNVLRGLHLQIKKPQAKFITVLKGKIFDVVVDCRKNSKTFGQYFSIILTEKKNISIFIPEGFAHGYCSLSDDSLLHYKMSNYRHVKLERGIIWDDNRLNIKWPIKNPIVSSKDKKNKLFSVLINEIK